jgi:chromosome segregation ATPase
MTKSPETPRDLRKKLKRSTDSCNSIKDKQRETQYTVKILKNCLSAMTTSREKWRLKCEEDKVLIKKLEQKLSDITENHNELITKLECIDSSIIKKKMKSLIFPIVLQVIVIIHGLSIFPFCL